MNRLAEILAILSDSERKASLTDSQVGSLERELLALFDAVTQGTVEGVESDDLDRLNEIGEAVDQVRAVAAERLDAAAQQEAMAEERAAKIEALREKLHPAAETPPEEVGDDGEEQEESDGEEQESESGEPAEVTAVVPAEVPVAVESAPAAEAAAPASEPELVPVAAATRAAVPALATIQPPASMAPAARTSPRSAFLSLLSGRPVDANELANLLIEQRHRQGFAPPGFTEDMPIARQALTFPTEMTLSSRDGFENVTSKIEAAVAGAMLPSRWQDEALVASGGWCAPPAVDYSFPSISGSQRPVRDALPRFQADRGALTYVRPTPFTDVVTGGPSSSESGLTTAAVGIWTDAIDQSPGSNVKGCQTVPCPTPTTVTLDAIYWCMQFGNFMTRAYPELIRQWMDNLEVAWARHAEIYLLDKIDAASTAVTSVKVLGTYRDLLANVIQAAAGYRSRHRMLPNARLRYLAPAWVLDAMSADRVREAASARETLTVDEATIRREFDNVGINVTFYEDSATGAGQIMGAQGPTDLRNWPTTVRQYLFHEGAFVHLDGGELDLGLVRDSALNKTNDYRLFYETFENVAYRGFESIKLTSTVCPDGMSAIPVTTANLCAAS